MILAVSAISVEFMCPKVIFSLRNSPANSPAVLLLFPDTPTSAAAQKYSFSYLAAFLYFKLNTSEFLTVDQTKEAIYFPSVDRNVYHLHVLLIHMMVEHGRGHKIQTIQSSLRHCSTALLVFRDSIRYLFNQKNKQTKQISVYLQP